MFAVATESLVGNGRTTCFWTNRWLHGSRLEDLAPNVVKCVSLRIRKRRSIFEALQGNTWVTDIQGALGWRGLAEYLELWDMLANVNLNDTEDIHRWKLEASGIFSTRSAYKNFFVGAITFEPWKKVWKTWAPGKCKTFVWLAIRNRCWTADRLQKKRPPIPRSLPSL